MGKGCNTQVTFETGYGYNLMHAFIDYSQKTRWAVNYVNITNLNTTTVTVRGRGKLIVGD